MPQFTVRPPTAGGALREKTARPTTARAAPPRILKKAEEIMDTLDKMDTQIQPMESVITEADPDKNDDDLFVVEETMQDDDRPMDNLEIGLGANISGDALAYGIEKGSLVKQLVETKNQLEGKEAETIAGLNVGTTQIAQLKNSIQTFTRYAAPLATILDYLQQHINSMISEYNESNSQCKQNIAKLAKQRSLVDTELGPLREQLSTLENEIRNTSERIEGIKANIIRNEERCKKIINLALEMA